MLGPFTFTFTFTLESKEFEKSEKVACAALDLYKTMITTRAPDGANKSLLVRNIKHSIIEYKLWYTSRYPSMCSIQ